MNFTLKKLGIGAVIVVALAGGSVAVANAATSTSAVKSGATVQPGQVTPSTAQEFTFCVRKDDHNPVKGYVGRAGCAGSSYDTFRWLSGKQNVAVDGPLSADGTVLTHVGGPIATGITPITQDVTLPAGTYEVLAYGDFSRKAGTGADNPAGNGTYGTMVVWGDKNNDGVYDWQNGEQIAGTAQTGALPVTPTGSIEQSTSINDVFTLTQATTVRLGGFGYNSNTGSYGTVGQPGAGDFSVLGAHATFIKLNV